MNEYRDENGHYTSEENDGGECLHNGGVKEYRQNTPYEELTGLNKKSIIQLSNREWAQFYAKLGEIELGGHVDTMSNGNKMIPIGNKLVISSGTYEEPKVERIFEFPNEEELFDWLNEEVEK